MQKNIIRFLKRNFSIIIFLSIILFPLLLGLIFLIPIIKLLPLSASDCLLYYGASLGILASFTTYRHEIKKEQIQRTTEVKPIINIEVEKGEGNTFKITINNHSPSILSYLYIYDEFISVEFSKKHSIIVSYFHDIGNIGHNITMDSEILDIDGYPKYVQILCEDIDQNNWNLCYYKVVVGEGKYMYYLRDIEII